MEIDFLKAASKYLNFSYTLQITTAVYASIELMQGRGDIMLRRSEFDSNNENFLPFDYTLSGVFYKEQYEFSPFYFISVFNPSLWISLVITIFLIFMLLLIFNQAFKIKLSNLSNSIFHTLGVSDENVIHHSKLSIKIIQYTFAVFTFCIAASFSSFLSAEISIMKDKFPFKSLQEMADQNDYRVCANFRHSEYKQMDKVKFSKVLNPPSCTFLRFEIVKNGFTSVHDMCNDEHVVYIMAIDDIDWVEEEKKGLVFNFHIKLNYNYFV